MKTKSLCSIALKVAGVISLAAISAYGASNNPNFRPLPENPAGILALLSMGGVTWQYLRARKKS